MPSPEPPQPKRTHTYRSPPHKHKMPEFHEPSPPAPSHPSPPEHDNRDHENYIQQRYGKSEDAAMRTAKTLQDIQNRINELMQNIGSEPGYGNYGDGEYGRNGYAPYGGRGYGNGFGGGPGYGGFEGDFGGFRDAFSGFSHPFFPREHNHINNRGRRRSARSRNDVHDDYRHPDMRDDWFWTK
ncbi:hypothetical protein L596_027933 [Steinernema carpocapsae]|nr:hypothetical protein L596_027933 [Steinernema carpocapsae]